MLPDTGWRRARTWEWLGCPAFLAMAAVYFLMVVKPARASRPAPPRPSGSRPASSGCRWRRPARPPRAACRRTARPTR
ncbi:DUF2269 family protein [Burkholderia plantarii]|uniref:DUF2269 family protein n=1 Tax=Burkholderia plantarii TaxID=41899 RepID=UPI003557FB86